jgi:hypothetical protein
VFTNLLLADEINRAPAKTQSALLEAMQEGQVTIEGTSFPLPPPFMCLATQNPLELEGTYPLPEAQLDRFLLKVLIGYPSLADETRMVAAVSEGRMASDFDLGQVQRVASQDEVLAMQLGTAQVRVDPAVLDYAVRIAAATRKWPGIALGAGPRGSIGLVRAARAQAVLGGRDFVTPDDLREIAKPVLRHRIECRWRRSCRSKASRPTTCCMRCWPRWTRPASEADAAPGAVLRRLGLAGPGDQLRRAAGGRVVGGGRALLLLVALVDAVRTRPAAPLPEVARSLPDALPLGVERNVTLVLDAGARAQRVDVHDLHPGGWIATGLPRRLQLAADASTRFDYRPAPHRTRRCALRRRAPAPAFAAGACGAHRAWSARSAAVRVYPDFAPLARLRLAQRRTGLARWSART